MDSLQISAWDHVFSLLLHTKIHPKKTINLLLKDKFSGESEISVSAHSLLFLKKYLSCKITDLGLLCRLFSLSFAGQIRKWFDTFKIGSIHSWVHFQTSFISAHQNYDYDQLCDAIESLERDEYESIDHFNSSILRNYYRFLDDDRPSIKYFDKMRLSLIQSSLLDFEFKIFHQ